MNTNEIVGVTLQVDGTETKRSVGEIKTLLDTAKSSVKAMADQFGENSDQVNKAKERVKQYSDELARTSEPVKSLRAQIREATQELAKTNEQFGTLSPQAAAAAKKVADLKDQFADAAALAEAFNPDKKFTAVTQSLQGVIGGFAALQGTMALFGIESESVQKTLLKVQGALALSQGVNSVLDSIQGFKNLGAIIQQTTLYQKSYSAATAAATAIMNLFGISGDAATASMVRLRTAIATTGIGTIVVLVGVLVSQLMDLASSTDEAERAQRRLNNALEDQSTYLKDVLSGISYETKVQEERAKLAGKSENDLFEIRKSGREREIAELKLDKDRKLKLYEESLKVEYDDDKKREETVSKARQARDEATRAYNAKVQENTLATYAEANRIAQKARDDQEKKQKEADSKAEAAAKQAAQRRKAELERNLAEAKQLQDQVQQELSKFGKTDQEKELIDLKNQYDKRLEVYRKAGYDTTEITEAYNAKVSEINQKYRDKELEEVAQQVQKDAEARQKKADEDAQALKDSLDVKLYQWQDEKTAYQDRRDQLDQFNKQVIANDELSEKQRTALLKESSMARRQIDKEEQEAKKSLLQSTASILGSFSEIAGEQTAVGKTLAIASTIISTYQGAQEAFTALAGTGPYGPVLGAAAAAAAVVAGIARVKKIIEVKVPGKANSSTNSISSSTNSFTAPAISGTSIGTAPIVPTAQAGGSGMSAMLGQFKKTQDDMNNTLQRLNEHLDSGIHANIIEGEVSGTLGRTKSIEDGATLTKTP